MSDYNQKEEIIRFLRKSNNLHHTYATFKNYSREEAMKMTKLNIFLVYLLLKI